MRRSLLVALFAATLSVGVQAGPIYQASSVTATTPDFGGAFALVNMINQSGLSAGYTSGVTNFDTYAAGTTHNGLEGFSLGPGGQFSFDLGSALTIDALAFWASTNIGAVRTFDLYADTDQNFGNGVGAFLGSFSAPLGIGNVSAQVFGFGATTTQFLHIDVLTTHGGLGLPPGIGEIAFRGVGVPEPATLALLGLGLVGVARIRKVKSA